MEQRHVVLPDKTLNVKSYLLIVMDCFNLVYHNKSKISNLELTALSAKVIFLLISTVSS